MSSPSQYYLLLCLFLVSFSSVINSQSSPGNIQLLMKNETPKTVIASCYLGNEYIGVTDMIAGLSYEFNTPIVPGGNNTFTCEMKFGEKHGNYQLFDMNDTKTCHSTTEVCNWSIREDGLCLWSAGKCVLFKWDTTHHTFTFNVVTEPFN
ncbi:hypothetical protein HAX54_015975 [Datura stramonium]|uniref:S-protein homolog n=1 Tax=Datura stramonium TaxID=4076 RepID=A0ABS8UJF8_DATST|nr:hypothetical protein [Datura stramonium]